MQLSKNQSASSYKISLAIFMSFAAGFVINCLLRSMNPVLESSINQDIPTSVMGTGFFVSIYFLAYGLSQLPLGVLLDRFGARATQIGLFITAIVGLLLFASAHNICQLVAARILMGIGMAGGLMCALKIIVEWFLAEKIPVLNGIMMTCGGVGILLAATPTQQLIDYLGWRQTCLLFAVALAIVVMLIGIFVPKRGRLTTVASFEGHLKGIINIYKDPFFWRITPLISCVLGSFMAIQGLWVENWLVDVNHFSQAKVDNYLLVIGVAMTLSLLGTGYIAKWLGKYAISMIKILEVSTVLYLLNQAALIFGNWSQSWVAWFLLGFLSHKFNLCYSIFAKYFPASYIGRANTALNVITFVMTFLVQYLIGVIIQWCEPIGSQHSVVPYQIAFGIVLLIQALSYVWYLIFPLFFRDRETAGYQFDG